MNPAHAVTLLAVVALCATRKRNLPLLPCSPTAAKSIVEVTHAEVVGSSHRAAVTLRMGVRVSAVLASSPKLKVTIENGINPSCSSASGPCTFKICDPITDIEEQLFVSFGSQCPIPVGYYTVKITVEKGSSPRDSENADIITMKLNFTDDDVSVGCTAFSLN